MSTIVSLVTGALFGFALARGRVHEGSLIVGQMTMENFVMLKMFLAACATSMLGFALLEKFGVETTRNNVTKNFHRGLPAVILGTSLLGAGMALTGSCPGTVFAQLGAGSSLAFILLAGGLAGSYLFARVVELPGAREKLADGKLETTSVSSLLGWSVQKTSLTLGTALLAFVLVLEVLVPWTSDVAKGAVAPTWSTGNPPSMSGVLVGLAQIFLQLMAKKTLGSSTSYSAALGLCAPIAGAAKECPSHLQSCAKSHKWQVLVMAGVVVGSFLASVPYVGLPFTATNALLAFVGGMMMVGGAQIAGGCTAGHGLSGFGFLSVYSLVGVCSMFGSAIATGILVKVFF